MKKFDLTFYLLLLSWGPLPIVLFVLWPLEHSWTAWSGSPLFQEFLVIELEDWLLRISWGFCFLSFFFAWFMAFRRKDTVAVRVTGVIIFLVATILWFGSAIPAFGKAREHARRTSCGSNLRQIYLSFQQYAENSQGNLPPELQTLVKSEYLTDPGIYRCPSYWKDNGFTDYLYFGAGRKLSEKPPFILIEDLPDNHPGTFRNRLYSNGKIENGYPGVAAK